MIYKFSYGDHWKKIKISGSDKPHGKPEPQALSESQEARYRAELAVQWGCLIDEVKLEELEES